MRIKKFSLSLPITLIQFIEEYQKSNHYVDRTVVIKEAIELLRQKELEKAYREASLEIDPIWDVTILDGLNNETW